MVSTSISHIDGSRRMVHDEAHVYSAATTLWPAQKEDEIKTKGNFQVGTTFITTARIPFHGCSLVLFKLGIPIGV